MQNTDPVVTIPVKVGVTTSLFNRIRSYINIPRLDEYAWNLIMAAFIGALGSSAALFYGEATLLVRWAMTGSYHSGSVVAFMNMSTLGRFLVPTLGGLAGGLILHIGIRILKTKGTEYMEAVALGDGSMPIRSSIFRALSGLFSIGSGESIGREGPMVQISAMLASIFGNVTSLSPARKRLMVACGAAAGWTMAYNAPIGGAMFVSEVLMSSIAMESFGPIVVASISSSVTKHLIGLGHQHPIYEIGNFQMGSPQDLILFAGLGLLVGSVAGIYIHILKTGKKLFSYLNLPLYINMAIGGAIVGLFAMYYPEVTGNGYSSVVAVLHMKWVWTMVLLILVLKIIATSAVFGSGAVGGVFTPTLMVGASVGYLFASLAGQYWNLSPIIPNNFTMVGMGAFLAAVTHAPLMAIMIVFEMTYSPAIIVPMTLASLVGYYTAKALGSESIYKESLEHPEGGASVLDQPLSQITVRAIMHPPKHRLNKESTLPEIEKEFRKQNASLLHVQEGEGTYLGSVLRIDMERFVGLKGKNGSPSQLKADDIYREDIPILTPDLGLVDAFRIFTKEDYDELPVLDSPDDRRLVGVLSRSDLLMTISEAIKRHLISEHDLPPVHMRKLKEHH